MNWRQGRILLQLCILTILGVLFIASTGFADDNQCLQCHADKDKGKSVHPAVTFGCRICHIGLDASVVPHKSKSGMEFGLTAEKEKICFSCHKSELYTKGTSVHMPVAAGLCIECHDPHSSRFDHLLREKNICFRCHNKNDFISKKVVHMPVALDMCVSCHNPHRSDNQKLLEKNPPELCFDCHDKKEFTKKNNHRPVSLGMCLSCHEIHQSNYSALKRELVPELCFICHGKEEVYSKKIHKEYAASQGGVLKCLTCHSPHDG